MPGCIFNIKLNYDDFLYYILWNAHMKTKQSNEGEKKNNVAQLINQMQDRKKREFIGHSIILFWCLHHLQIDHLLERKCTKNRRTTMELNRWEIGSTHFWKWRIYWLLNLLEILFRVSIEIFKQIWFLLIEWIQWTLPIVRGRQYWIECVPLISEIKCFI